MGHFRPFWNGGKKLHLQVSNTSHKIRSDSGRNKGRGEAWEIDGASLGRAAAQSMAKGTDTGSSEKLQLSLPSSARAHPAGAGWSRMTIIVRPQGIRNSVRAQLRPGQPEVPFPMYSDLVKPKVTNQTVIHTSHGLESWIPAGQTSASRQGTWVGNSLKPEDASQRTQAF